MVKPRHCPIVVCGPHVVSIGVDAFAGGVGVFLLHDFLDAAPYPVHHLYIYIQNKGVFGRGDKGITPPGERKPSEFRRQEGAVATFRHAFDFVFLRKTHMKKHTCCVP